MRSEWPPIFFGDTLECIDYENIEFCIGYYVKKGGFALSEGQKMAIFSTLLL